MSCVCCQPFSLPCRIEIEVFFNAEKLLQKQHQAVGIRLFCRADYGRYVHYALGEKIVTWRLTVFQPIEHRINCFLAVNAFEPEVVRLDNHDRP